MHRLLISLATLSLMASSQLSIAQDVKAGGDLFNDNCAICHGNKGQGIAQAAVPDGAVRVKPLTGDSAYWDFAVFKKSVMEGRDDKDRAMRVMPVFGKVGFFEPPGAIPTDDELKNIQAYMQSLGPKQ